MIFDSLSTRLTFRYHPDAVQHEDDGLWYPQVEARCDHDPMPLFRVEYDFPLDDYATAMTFARSFARELSETAQRSLEIELSKLNQDLERGSRGHSRSG